MKKLNLLLAAGLIAMLSTSCGSENSTSSSKSAPATESGAAIYNRTCIACHQANGAGIPNTYPPLAKSDFLADKDKSIMQVIKGQVGELVVNGVKYNSVMPPQPLNDDEIASVLTYVNSSFGNTGPVISAADVKEVRAGR